MSRFVEPSALDVARAIVRECEQRGEVYPLTSVRADHQNARSCDSHLIMVGNVLACRACWREVHRCDRACPDVKVSGGRWVCHRTGFVVNTVAFDAGDAGVERRGDDDCWNEDPPAPASDEDEGPTYADRMAGEVEPELPRARTKSLGEQTFLKTRRTGAAPTPRVRSREHDDPLRETRALRRERRQQLRDAAPPANAFAYASPTQYDDYAVGIVMDVLRRDAARHERPHLTHEIPWVRAAAQRACALWFDLNADVMHAKTHPELPPYPAFPTKHTFRDHVFACVMLMRLARGLAIGGVVLLPHVPDVLANFPTPSKLGSLVADIGTGQAVVNRLMALVRWRVLYVVRGESRRSE